MPEESTPTRNPPISGLKHHRILVLDSNYMPTGIPLEVIEAEAVVQILIGNRSGEIRAEVIEKSPYSILRGERDPFPLPSIIRMLHPVENLHNVLTGKLVPFSRTNLTIRDESICQYTGKALRWGHPDPHHRATFDHIIPRSQDGESNWMNAVLASEWANNICKSNMTPSEARFWLRQEPWEPTIDDLLYLAAKKWLEDPTVQECWKPFLHRVEPTARLQRKWDNDAAANQNRENYFAFAA